jgi:branched-subunit amino acid ABC-type transport system permease component
MKTRFGVHARATMQNAAMARALGVPVNRVYTITFGLGAALAGLAGGLYAPTMTLSPMMGASFVIEAFVTVVAGGSDILLGTPPAALLLAVIKASATALYGQVYGVMGLLVAVCFIVRVLPEGFTGWLVRRRA